MGFIVLTGTVVNNSILLIDAYLGEIAKRHKKRYLTVYDYFNLSKKRLRPMLATTITTVTGLLPLIVSTSGSHLWQGFAITLTAGLCGSLLFILVTTPLLFDLYQKKFINP
jgi:HAE1 family hydrophobic/amphiphilic exporter-1